MKLTKVNTRKRTFPLENGDFDHRPLPMFLDPRGTPEYVFPVPSYVNFALACGLEIRDRDPERCEQAWRSLCHRYQDHVRTAKAEPVILLFVQYEGRQQNEHGHMIGIERGWLSGGGRGDGEKTGLVLSYVHAFRVNGHLHYVQREGYDFFDDAKPDSTRVGMRYVRDPCDCTILPYTSELEAKIEQVIAAVNGAVNVMHGLVEAADPAALLLSLGGNGRALLAAPSDEIVKGAEK